MSKALAGRVAVLTGGTGGIGAAVAGRLAEAGAEVVIGSRKAGEATGAGDGISGQDLDVRSTRSVDAFMDKVLKRHGRIDILVCAAGSCHSAGLGTLSDADWDDEIGTMLSGTFRCLRACLPVMIDRNWGRIISIASDIALLGSAEYPAYAAAKAGVVSLTRSAALTGARYNVTGNTISPGWVDTAMARAAIGDLARTEQVEPQALLDALTRLMPRCRLVDPDEIASIVVHLCLDTSGAITMQDIAVDGGARWYMDRLEVAQ
ncbi:SDR family oxidoreductase [Roseibium sp. AS2]|uniref:SDR family NAD(P)-dependent oxidoreductase n=1 Tax=Roseibium sp. AS2 TaxID=3135781 RepID=UPI00317EEEA1